MGDACGREDSFEGGVEALGAEPLPLLLGAPYFDVAQSAVALSYSRTSVLSHPTTQDSGLRTQDFVLGLTTTPRCAAASAGRGTA